MPKTYNRKTHKFENITQSQAISVGISLPPSTKRKADDLSPTPAIKRNAQTFILKHEAQEPSQTNHQPHLSSPSPRPSTPDQEMPHHPHLSSPSPISEQEIIDTVRQQCWLLDQILIYGTLVRRQKAESARIKAETGAAPEPESFECPFVLSEFAVEERERAGLGEDEEREFLWRRRGELRGLVNGEGEKGKGDGDASETVGESDAVAKRKRGKKVVLKGKGEEVEEEVEYIRGMKWKRKVKEDDEAWEPVLKSKGKAKVKASGRAREPVAVSKSNMKGEKTSSS
jgi:hypothetical protein